MNKLSEMLYSIAETAIKIGEIRSFSGAVAPDKWKVCDGSVINRSTYAKLFNVIATTYGGGNGSTTFALPNLKGRTMIGVGENTATGHTAHTLGQYAGEEKHTLSVAELASHAHSFKNDLSRASGGGNDTVAGIQGANAIGSTNGQGSNSAHNTMQPYMCVNYIIYTGVGGGT